MGCPALNVNLLRVDCAAGGEFTFQYVLSLALNLTETKGPAAGGFFIIYDFAGYTGASDFKV